uniref:Putative peptidase n=1 Tax=viral metagenome TaxID=1070528 RepID=A0A6M3LQE3_9ZZZZ
MCFNLFKKKEVVLVEPIVISRSPYKNGDASGNMPSMRVDIKPEDVTYDKETKTLTIKNIEPEVEINTVQNTNSMEPFLDVGHIVVLSNNPKYIDDLKLGDVIIFDAGNGQTIIHSIVEIGSDGEQAPPVYVTQGWNIKSPDPYQIYREQILNTVILVIPSKEYYNWIPGEND